MLMKIAEKISQQIKCIPEDSTFGYEQLNIGKEEYVTAAKALERLQKKGIIKKVSKGIFYKPKSTVFGLLKPNEQELLKPYLFQDGRRIAYITGNYLYNQLGLTTQLSKHLTIACRSKRIYINTATIKATPVKSYAEVTDDNYQLLGFLDAIKDLKTIPDAVIESALTIFSSRIQKLEMQKITELIEYALLYPPRVRALLGALLEQTYPNYNLSLLKDSLNPLTKFELGISHKYLKTSLNWNIR